jgi:hypothetical protein
MDFIEELLAEEEARRAAYVQSPNKEPECPYCLGRKLIHEGENGSTDAVLEFIGVFDYQTWEGVHQMRWAHRLIHKQYGFEIKIHNCADLPGRDDYAFTLGGPWPRSPEAIAALDAFIRYARRGHETRGQGNASGVELNHILDALAREPEAKYVRLALMLGIGERTIRERLKPLGGIRKARIIAKNRQTKRPF